ncbi:MAG: hypothetical protein U9Q66_01685 [Patescibacteria group bacterium]|nr:hypothetical protein [Patescibacteria group bacterium]
MSTKIQADEISAIIEERIDNFELDVDSNNSKKVLVVGVSIPTNAILDNTFYSRMNDDRKISQKSNDYKNYGDKSIHKRTNRSRSRK